MDETDSPNEARHAENTPNTPGMEARSPDLEIRPGPASGQAQPSKPQHSGTQYPDAHWWSRWKPFVEITGLALLLIYTVFTAAMYFATKEAADAAKLSADAALLSAQAIRPRLAVAYLTPQPLRAGGLPMDQGRLHAWFQLPNYGPYAAQNVKICEFDDVEAPSEIARLPYENCQSSSNWSYGSTIIPPITELPGNEAPGWGMDGSHVLTSEEATGLKNPADLNAVFSVMATYEDAAGRTHHAESCVVFTFQSKWGTQSMGPVTWGSKPCPWKTQNN